MLARFNALPPKLTIELLNKFNNWLYICTSFENKQLLRETKIIIYISKT